MSLKAGFLALVGGACASLACAQPTIVADQTTLLADPDTMVAGSTLELHVEVSNETDAAMSLYVTRAFVDTVSPFNYPYSFGVEGSYERFCWGPTCFNYGTDSSPLNAAFLVTLQPGQTTSTFRADFYPNGVVGESTLKYCFVPVSDPPLQACQELTFGLLSPVAVPGCMDADAWNFNPDATEDDGSCVFADYSCLGIGGVWWSDQPSGAVWGGGAWTAGLPGTGNGVLHLSTQIPAFGQAIQVNSWMVVGHQGLPVGLSLTLNESSGGPENQTCFHVEGTSSDIGVHAVSVLLDVETVVFGNPLVVEDVPVTFELEVLPHPCGVVGCTLPVAVNFNPQAVIDDGTCFLAGCTDPGAINHHPAFTFDDGSCVYDDPTGGSCLMDGDGDGTIGVGDLLTLLTMFGTTCQL
jgi:hypothetical protein